MNYLIKKKQIPNLTPIRFILALLVVVFHIPQFCENRGFPFFNDLAVFHKGIEAVYVFFSLSGFLIINQLYVEKTRTNTINLKAFFWRRILRIFPLYYLILGFGFLYYHFILPNFGFDYENNYDLISGLFLSITFFPNIFSKYAPGGIIEILWSIGIEEQFYLFIAPLFFILPLKRILLFLGGFTIIYFLMFFSEYLFFLKKYDMLFFYFSFSGLLAIVLNRPFFQNFILKIRYIVLILFILYFTTALFKDHLNAVFYQLYSVVLFGLTICVLAQKPIKVLENKVMNYLGKISYGIYMYHAIMIQLVGFLYIKGIAKLNLNDTLDIIIIFFLIITLTILISHFSFKYYESYFLKWKHRINIKK